MEYEKEILSRALVIANNLLEKTTKEKNFNDIESLERTSMSFRDCANLLGIKLQDFKTYLLENNYIYLTKTVKKIRCHPQYSTNKGNGLFYLKVDYAKDDNRELIQTKITLKGYEYFKKKLIEEGVIYANF